MWKPKKWDEDLTQWKMSFMILMVIVSVIAFLAGQNSNFPITGQAASAHEFSFTTILLAIVSISSWKLGRTWERKRSV